MKCPFLSQILKELQNILVFAEDVPGDEVIQNIAEGKLSRNPQVDGCQPSAGLVCQVWIKRMIQNTSTIITEAQPNPLLCNHNGVLP
jgi:hypothetical protein